MGPWDGVYLALHGALAVRNIPRPEAEIAKRVREVVGKDTPILTATVLQWTGAAPASEIMERARRWEARERGAFVSVFFGYPWSDVPDVGVTTHVMTNDDQQLADQIADDMDEFVWRVREPFAHAEFPMPEEAVVLARNAIAAGETPVAIGDYSDRPGDATWILQEILDQGVEKVLYSALRDENALAALKESGAETGDAFDMEVGGFSGESAGSPVRIQGTIRYIGEGLGFERVAVVDFGASSTLILSPTYQQTMFPETMRFGGIEPDDYDVFIVKSRAHFRWGFDESGYAKTILVVDAPGPWVGTTRLDALDMDYQFAPIDRMYPFGETGR